jgi:hypothetical protein
MLFTALRNHSLHKIEAKEGIFYPVAVTVRNTNRVRHIAITLQLYSAKNVKTKFFYCLEL